MAANYDRANEIITLSAQDDAVDSPLDIVGIYFYSSAAGVSEVKDSSGNVIARCGTTATNLCRWIPINRKIVGGVKATTLATNHTIYVYVKKS